VLEGVREAQRAGARAGHVEIVLDEMDATRKALGRARSGDVVVLCVDYATEVYKELEQIRKQFSLSAAMAEPPQIINGKALSLGRPLYPQGARDRQLSGTVYVLVEIDETGKVISARDMCQGPPYLSESAVDAAFKSRFTPTKLSGMPVKVKGVITYNFVNTGTTYR